MTKKQLKRIKEILKKVDSLEKTNEENYLEFVRKSFGTIARALVVFIGTKKINSAIVVHLWLFSLPMLEPTHEMYLN